MNKNLISLKKGNSKVEVLESLEGYKVINPWNDSSVSFFFKKRTNLVDLKNIVFPERLAAIFNSKSNSLEFIYGPVDQTSKILNRKFDFIYKGLNFICSFEKISNSLNLLAKNFQENTPESKTDHRNLRFLRDIYKDDFYKDLFENAELISFYIKGDFAKLKNDFVGLCKSLNFYMAYFDRETPKILIYGKDHKEEKYIDPCLYKLFDDFPSKINATTIDSTILDTFMVAENTANLRMKFIFYFQVLEYASYYYLDRKVHSKILKTLKDPDVLNRTDYFSKNLIEDLKNHFSQKDDSIKLEKTITETISISDIKNEIEANQEYFSKDLEFDGGLKISKVLNGDNPVENLKEGDLILIKKNIEKIRNVLVHLRESRENKVILPSAKNNNKLLPYLFLLRRIAEKVAVNFS
jgi:hypothetical protein